MDEKVINNSKKQIHPQETANFFSYILFCWPWRIFVKSYKKPLTEDDLYAPLKEHDSKRITDQLEKLWMKEEYFQENPSLWRPIFRIFGLQFVLLSFLTLFSELVILIIQPVCLKKLLDYHTPNQQEITQPDAYLYAFYVVLLCMFRTVTFHWNRVATFGIGMKLRMACCSLMYRKALKMKKMDFQKMTVGNIVNTMSNGVARLDMGLSYIYYIWNGIIELIILCLYLYFSLGSTSMAGASVLIICILLQLYVYKQTSFDRNAAAQKTDYRMHLMNDIVFGIKIIKMYTWEKPFGKLVESIRRLELDRITKNKNLRILLSTCRLYMGILPVIICILALTEAGLPLTPQYVFVAVTVYESLKTTVVVCMTRGTIQLSELIVTIKRIQDILINDREKAGTYTQIITESLTTLQKKPPGIKSVDVSVKWDDRGHEILRSVTFDFAPGELIGIIGKAGVGKSTLLEAILGENIVKGVLQVNGVLSYASQEPWIFPGTFRQNILFGEEMDQVKYAKVIRICALEHDLAVFPHGDETLVGERGVMLSGGQKARINIARAVYREADIYLLDDPLSAVDAHVAKQIFTECILSYLKLKCVVLVTHQVHYSNFFQKVYNIEENKMILVEKHNKCNTFIEEKTEISLRLEHDSPMKITESGTTAAKTTAYKSYCTAGGGWFTTVITLSIFVIAQFIGNTTDYFLSFWVNLESKDFEANSFWNTQTCLYFYTGFTSTLVLVSIAGTYTFSNYCKKASVNIHKNMLTRLFKAPMTFFNNHTSGRILNRFSKDLGIADEVIPMSLIDTTIIFLLLLGTYIMISILNYWLIIPTIILCVIFVCLAILSYPASKSMKRIEGACRSPIFTYLANSLQGLTTIRAFKAQEILEQEFDNHQNHHSVPFHLSVIFYTAFGFWIDILCSVYVTLVIFSFFLEGTEHYIGDVGLAITQSLSGVMYMQYGMKLWSDLDSQMTSVERVIEYTELPSETDDGKNIPPETWPNHGSITFGSVSIRYSSDAAFALNQVSFHIKSGEKIGIVGRTGAGKSTLISIIFRLFPYDGKILIDGVDIATIPLKSLRSQICIIPQEPVLFAGSLRENLDPFDKYSDLQLWQALEEVELKSVVTSLSSNVSEGGRNFSVGQRQLLCLVRAILRNARIIILDEATASVDLKTDELIQMTIRRRFKKSTVLTIAHRLNSVMDSDRILVLEGGRVVEFDEPNHLLENSNGLFYSYVHKNVPLKGKK